MQEQNAQLITRNDIKLLVGIIAVILSIAFAWSDLKHEAENAVKEAVSAKEKAEVTTAKQDKMALDIIEIKTILKQQGLTTKANKPLPLAMSQSSMIAQPTPGGQSAQLQPEPLFVYNYIQAKPDEVISTPTPTPLPSPTPTPLLCVVGICLEH